MAKELWSVDGGTAYPIFFYDEFGNPICQDEGLTKRDYLIVHSLPAIIPRLIEIYPKNLWHFVKRMLAYIGIRIGKVEYHIDFDARVATQMADVLAKEWYKQRKLFYKPKTKLNGGDTRTSSDDNNAEDAVSRADAELV